MSSLSEKNILFISVKFFNYEFLIKEQLIKFGAKVDLFDERPSNSFISKATIRLKKELYKKRIKEYYRGIINIIKNNKYDYFLLIKGEAIPVFFINFIKDNNPGIKLIYYTYDSFKNNPNGLEILNYFDLKFTFDTYDAVKYNIGFRPLFYASDYNALYSNRKDNLAYSLSFIGTAHSDRYPISEFIKKWCREQDLKTYMFYYSPSKILFNFLKIFKKSFRNFDRKLISYKSLSHYEIIELYSKSKSILDINHPRQKGLTMRTFEALGTGCKLITTNEEVKKYPFYNANNILVIDRKNIELEKEFFNTDFKKIDKQILHKMSLKGWVEDIFELNNTEVWSSVIK